MTSSSLAAVCLTYVLACTAWGQVSRQAYGKMPDGTPVDLYTLKGSGGMTVGIITYGGAVVSVTVPDRTGKPADVVLGMDSLDGYRGQPAFLGALIGRYGNRIGRGQFTLEGRTYHLPKNNGENTLHGGPEGFDKKVWRAREASSPDGRAVELTYVSKDGEMGFPGALTAHVTYTVTSRNELKIDYTATTDKPTVVNLTNHSYFNLAGGDGDVLGYQVTINADRYNPTDSGLIPTGEMRSVQGTPFDFRRPMAIGARIGQKDEQLTFGLGYDHNYVLNKGAGGLSKAAEVYDPKSGRVLEVLTTEPGLQFYTGNHLDGNVRGKGGKVYAMRTAFCMETQHFPDSPNKPAFPSTELKPGETYRSTTVYRFSAR